MCVGVCEYTDNENVWVCGFIIVCSMWLPQIKENILVEEIGGKIGGNWKRKDYSFL